jgi:hypothetical protein
MRANQPCREHRFKQNRLEAAFAAVLHEFVRTAQASFLGLIS